MIHQYRSGGFNIVLDVNSGAVHVVDELVYQLIPVLEPLAMDGLLDEESGFSYARGQIKIDAKDTEIREAIQEIVELTDSGNLYTKDIYEPYIESFKNRQTVVKALCLHIAGC